ncbi:MAG: hypothetical protein HY399_08350 [Elusimicrobia bacterium]|nr:hypothetical protein [Elusimicrobiota bacterium]
MRRNSFKKILILAVLGMTVLSKDLCTESLVLSTYYPVPYGVYATLITTAQTTLARNSGQVVIGNINNPRPNVLRIIDGNEAVGRVLVSDASGNTGWQVSPGFSQVQIYDASGSWAVPGGVNRVMVEVWGGGGGGASDSSDLPSHPGIPGDGCAGGGGGYGRGIFGVNSLGSPYSVVVGNGGAGGDCGATTNGGSGGSSSFGSLITASGGTGATPTASCVNGSGGSGPGTSGNVFGINGGVGLGSTGIMGMGGQGGNGGAGGNAANPVNKDGIRPGGGGGPMNYSCTTRAGDGAPGRVVIYW